MVSGFIDARRPFLGEVGKLSSSSVWNRDGSPGGAG